MFCQNCGTQVDDTAETCSSCGRSLRQAASPPNLQKMSQQAPQPAPQPALIVVRSEKSAGLAAVLSFFWCGLGQIYNGQIGKGVIMGILYLISLVMVIIVIGIITTPILWIWGMIDAYKTAERINREMPRAF